MNHWLGVPAEKLTCIESVEFKGTLPVITVRIISPSLLTRLAKMEYNIFDMNFGMLTRFIGTCGILKTISEPSVWIEACAFDPIRQPFYLFRLPLEALSAWDVAICKEPRAYESVTYIIQGYITRCLLRALVERMLWNTTRVSTWGTITPKP